MRLALTFYFAILASLHAEVLLSPKGAELFPQKTISLMPQASTAVVLPPTNQTAILTAEWPAGVAESYNLYSLTNPAATPVLITNVAALSVKFPMLVWPEDGPTVFHWFVVKAVLNGLESAPSPIARFPLYTPTHVVITWPETGRATIRETSNVDGGLIVADSADKPLILPIQSGNHFFSSTNKISISLTNFCPENCL